MPRRTDQPLLDWGKRRPVTVASIFAGGGGWEVGAVMAGCKPVWASELQDDIAEAHHKALPGSRVFVGDVTTLQPSQVQPVDILCVSPPCQGYSWARVTRRDLGQREDLLVGLECLKFVEALRPAAVLMENVPRYAESQTFAQIVAALHGHGYRVDHGVVTVSDYGVPSTRRRLILRAVRGAALPWPEKQRPVPTWDEALADIVDTLPAAKPLAAWQERSFAACPPPAGLLLVPGGNPTKCTLPDGRQVPRAWYPPHRPGPTMVASAKSMTGYRVVSAQGRVLRFTARCAARLQSFPDWYPLPGEALAFKIVGNAVPPALAQAFIESVLPAVREA